MFSRKYCVHLEVSQETDLKAVFRKQCNVFCEAIFFFKVGLHCAKLSKEFTSHFGAVRTEFSEALIKPFVNLQKSWQLSFTDTAFKSTVLNPFTNVWLLFLFLIWCVQCNSTFVTPKLSWGALK